MSHMKIKKKYIGWIGFIRFEKVEISWNFRNIALPLSFDFTGPLAFVQILFITFIFPMSKDYHL
ncbi:gp46 [Sphingomonas phage PAU]|uniref:gp46 n=1 Tax=Sphingomonas phage PAU TaxID=1150991 RepID=UPI0002573133|nr:gp46 [Sphingomonas phage PAU]AFF28044.1 gp46 [Sphingomonas phage PAU]